MSDPSPTPAADPTAQQPPSSDAAAPAPSPDNSAAASDSAETAAPRPLGTGPMRVEKTMIEAAQDEDGGDLDCYECRSCGYTYEPLKGDNRRQVPGNTAFTSLVEDWRCPVCGAPKVQFANVGPKGTPSGFKENLGYGFGVNTLTPGQKNILIFGSLGVFFLLFLAFYGMG